MREKILKAIEEAYRKGLKDAKGLNDISPYLLTSQVVAQELANKFCQQLVVGRSEQLKAEDKDLPFADYLEKWYELPRYEKVYDRKDGKGTDTKDEVIKNYRRAFRL